MDDITEEKLISYTYRFFLLVALPFLVGAVFLPHSHTMDGQALDAPQGNLSGPLRMVTYGFNHTADQLAMTQSINAIFPLAEYMDYPPFVTYSAPILCFQDNGSYSTMPDGSKSTPQFYWSVLFNDNRSITVRPNSINCTTKPIGPATYYNWSININISSVDPDLDENVTFTPMTNTFPRITMQYGLLQGLAMIPVAYLFIWYPAVGIWKKLHKGMHEQ